MGAGASLHGGHGSMSGDHSRKCRAACARRHRREPSSFARRCGGRSSSGSTLGEPRLQAGLRREELRRRPRARALRPTASCPAAPTPLSTLQRGCSPPRAPAGRPRATAPARRLAAPAAAAPRIVSPPAPLPRLPCTRASHPRPWPLRSRAPASPRTALLCPLLASTPAAPRSASSPRPCATRGGAPRARGGALLQQLCLTASSPSGPPRRGRCLLPAAALASAPAPPAPPAYLLPSAGAGGQAAGALRREHRGVHELGGRDDHPGALRGVLGAEFKDSREGPWSEAAVFERCCLEMEVAHGFYDELPRQAPVPANSTALWTKRTFKHGRRC
ncbi:translation initiation factor IF-2 [Triticum aestivum]|uniref:translation initiation factor IF-2 n=1 Tax=Triticum aestivum TaxID=4565 RepID=UPI001D011172|nr:translation initiation factor IF-2-like [Triticum aestivum]